ncbi:MAG: carbohydrate ABC transporter permease [Lachnospiraceae bacterium]|jgi:multiple sugar transport system permease protein
MAENTAKAGRSPARQKKNFWYRDNTVGYVFVMPFIISFLLLTLVPMALSLYYSFCNYKIGSTPEWIGLDNFVNLFRDSVFLKSIAVTFQYVLIGVPLKLVFALLIAMLLTKPTKLQGFYRAIYYIPSLVGGSVAVALVWKQLFGSRGPVVTLIKQITGSNTFNFFGSTKWAFVSLVICNAWQFGSSMLIFASGLKQIPKDYYEAAEIDGAGAFRRFFSITLPSLYPIILFNLIMQLISGFMTFTQAQIITQGGPNYATNYISLFIFTEGFTYQHMGYACAASWVILVIMVVITAVIFKTSKAWVFYASDDQ